MVKWGMDLETNYLHNRTKRDKNWIKLIPAQENTVPIVGGKVGFILRIEICYGCQSGDVDNRLFGFGFKTIDILHRLGIPEGIITL